MKKIYIYSSFIIILVSSILVYFYQRYFGLTIDAYESALNSFIVSLIVLVVTVIVINLFDFKDIELKHTEWLLDNNNKILANIHKYLMLYSKLMPNNILKLLVEIELIITRESAFIVPDIESFQYQMNKSVLVIEV
ncbi:MAG TPA: hypothetical protein VK105_00415 [Virgibacillus sp.]|nr:hypothetical protein [Virgibacillus sp.]HLR65585.1 hypothetical protein [Virgibacillus sp.]